MVKRKAFIGFSTPFGYDYTVSSGQSKGNPVLEAPTGLLILYDEIWFVHEDVCPLNLRDKEFVHFLEIENLPEIDDTILEMLSHIKYKDFEWNWDIWHKVVENNSVCKRVDQHHRHLELGEISTTPRPDNPLNAILDLNLSILNKMDLISNTVTAHAMGSRLETLINTQSKANYLVKEIISNSIPCCQLKEGPYIEYIDDLRKSKYIKSFRDKIEKVIADNKEKSILELDENLKHEFNEFKNACLNDKIDKKKIFKSSLMDFILKPISLIIPQIEITKDAYDVARSFQEYRISDQYQWTGFVAEVESLRKE